MPLLRKRPFVKSSSCDLLPDDERVFHCEITDEIFKDYEEYCERIILVNSMVWSCEMTGKANLTYAEALESEKKARKSLRNFPMELRVPMMYLASKTKRCTFAEMSDDVFNFVRDKYFVGETIEVCIDGETWSEAHVLSVIAPKQLTDAVTTFNALNMSSLYAYEVEQFEEDENGVEQGQIAIVSSDRVRRSRGVFTREKNKLYLKQFVEQGPGGIIQVKESILQKYNISKVKFDQIFTGSAPEFPSSKKFSKLVGSFMKEKDQFKNERKPRQESIAKYVTKQDKFEDVNHSNLEGFSDTVTNNANWKNNADLSNHKSLKDEMLRVANVMKQRKEEEKLKKKEKSLLFAAYVKEWNKQKDDLVLEDHKPLPKMIPVELPGIPNKYFGDFTAILEFFIEFSKLLKHKTGFTHKIDCEFLRRALTVKEVAGPLSDIVQILLGTIFRLQEEEAEEYNEAGVIQDMNGIEDDNEDNGKMSIMRAVQLATAASKWSQTYLATPLSQLPLDSTTFSEVLRLHLLSSGSSGGEYCTKWRYQQRGGYNSEDDPGLRFKIKEPHVLQSLSKKHLTQMPLSYKIKVLNCLVNQILTYATIRDVIEEKQEKIRIIKYKIRSLQIAERKREADLILCRQKIKREANFKKEQEKLNGVSLKILEGFVHRKLEDLKRESEIKKAEFEKKYMNLYSQYISIINYLGSDRAYRRYWIFESIQGVFVEHVTEFSGKCLEKPVIPNPALAVAPPEDALSYVQKLFENELNGGNSDKENDINNLNGKKCNNWTNINTLTESKLSLIQDLLMCTANTSNCPVHASPIQKTNWAFISSTEDLDLLINSLNKRGLRESDLKLVLSREKQFISKYIDKCPSMLLNPPLFPTQEKSEAQMRLTRRYVDANLKFPPNTDVSEVLEMTLRDTILDLEEKIHLGGLGELEVNDRNIWRQTILNRGYDQQCTHLSWGHINENSQKMEEKTVDNEINPISYYDPGSYLVVSDEINSDIEEDLIENNRSVDSSLVQSLASALLQIGQAVLTKHLKRPLGFDEKQRNKEKDNLKYNALKRWEVSLMQSTSFAQIELHLMTLENSIVWSRSILDANCRICRKKTDDENMLLCDLCNKGHHIYCLKPKLTKIPKGDWFCDQCKPKEKTPQKRNRKVFKEEESGDELDDSKSWNSSVSIPLCSTCRSGGILIHCVECDKGWHSECLPQPQQRKGHFLCPTCSKQANQDKEWDPKVRRCAADAINNLDHYKKMLKSSSRHYSETESSEEPLIVKARKKRISKESTPENDNYTNKRPRRKHRSAPITNGSSNNDDSDEPVASLRVHRISKDTLHPDYAYENTRKSSRRSEGTISKRNSGSVTNGYSEVASRRSRRSEVACYEQLERLLYDIMHHKDSWPFNAPVTIEEVPDYFDIITHPMDFDTIKKKLIGKKYPSDVEFMNDAALVFENCCKYNHDDDIVAKAGARLQKFFEKRCRELNLICFPCDDYEHQSKKSKADN